MTARSTGSMAFDLERLAGPRLTALSVVMGVALALGGLVALNLLAEPRRYGERLAELQGRVARVEAVRARPGDAGAYPPTAICAQSTERQAAQLHDRLQRLGRDLALPLLEVSTSTDQAGTEPRVRPVGFRLDANGDYAAAIRMLGAMGALQPAILLDRVDLTSRGSFLHLHMNGRVLCWASATS